MNTSAAIERAILELGSGQGDAYRSRVVVRAWAILTQGDEAMALAYIKREGFYEPLEALLDDLIYQV